MAVNRDYLAIAEHISKKASMLGVMALTALKRRWMLLSATVEELGFCGSLTNRAFNIGVHSHNGYIDY